MSFFVIGGAGYIGSHFIRHSLDVNKSCVCYDNLSTGHIEAVDPRCKLIEGDLLDRERLQMALKESKPKAIFHFAAKALVNESMSNPRLYYQNNVEGVRVLLDVINEICPKTPLIFSSTCAVMGTPNSLPMKEDDIKEPISPYGRSKLMAENIIEDYTRAYGMKAIALRYFNACGALSLV